MEKSKEYYNLIGMESIQLRGDFDTKTVWLNDKEIAPDYSRAVFNHYSGGFDWGNPGDGSAQLALAVLLELTKNKKVSMILHHIFKNEFLSNLPESNFEIKINIGDWFFQNIHKSGMFQD